MNRATAENLMAVYQRLADSLNEATVLVGSIPDPDEQQQLRRPLGDMMQSVWLELMRPIIREFPDLDPDRKR